MLLFVAGAVFGEVAVSLFVAGAVFGEIWNDSRSALEMTFHLFSPNFSHILDGYFSWQVQYLVSVDTDTCCSAHCK